MKAYLQMISYKLLPVIRDKQLRSFIDKSNKQVDKLASLINDLLDVSKIQAGKMTYAFTTFNFNECIKEAVAEVADTTAEHKITINNALKDDVLFRGDRLRIEQVLINLLSNAIKYSPESDEVILDVMCEDNFIKVSVTDFGIGISEKQLPYIFDRFSAWKMRKTHSLASV